MRSSRPARLGNPIEWSARQASHRAALLLAASVSIACPTTGPEPTATIDCLDACAAGLQRNGTVAPDSPIHRLTFDSSGTVRAGDLEVALSVESGTVLDVSDARGVALGVTPGNIVELSLSPPLDAEQITHIQVRAHCHGSGGDALIGLASATGKLVPGTARALAFDELGVGSVPMRGWALWWRPIPAIGLHFACTDLDEPTARVDLESVTFWRSPDPDFDPAAEGTDTTATPSIERVALHQETRPALFAPAPSTCRCSVPASSETVLDVSYGLPATTIPQGVTFSAALVRPDGGRDALWEETVGGTADEPAERWQSARVELPRSSGTVELEFETRPALPAATGAALPALWGPLDVYRPAAPSERPPSVLLISLDTLRADHLGVYGYPRATSPALDRRAAGGVVFEHAISQAPETHLSHMALLTGRYPPETGATIWMRRSDDVPILVDRFRAAGYRTAAITEDVRFSYQYGFDDGFHSFRQGSVDDESPRPGKLLENTFAAARAWLRGHRDRPFFLVVHTYEVHSDLAPPPETLKAFADPAYRGKFRKSGWDAGWTAWLKEGWNLAPPDLAWLLANYDAAIRHLDGELDALLAVVDELGLADSTYRVIFADHGEEFLDHDGLGHGHSLYRELLRVPLIVLGPEGRIVPGRVREPVHLIDVLPTLLGLAGLPVEPGDSSGVDLGPALLGEPAPTRPVFSHAWNGASVVAEDDGCLYKLIYLARPAVGPRSPLEADPSASPTWQLYCLDEDPGETRDLSGLRPQVTRRLERALAEHLRAATPRTPGDAATIDRELEDNLRALGYLGEPSGS